MKRPPISPTESATEATTRQRIVAEARRHFLAHGFRGVTMDELAAELGMSKKTLYAHFSSKTALVEAALLDKFSQLEAELGRITTECAADFVAGLRQMLACFQWHAAEVQPAFIRDIQRDAPELFWKVEGRRQELIEQHFGKLLGEGRREGLVRKDVPVRLIMEIFLGATHAILNPPRLLELGMTPTDGLSGILAVVLEGALTPGGRSRL